MTDIAGLIERVEAASGPSVASDGAIHAFLFPEDFDEGDAEHYANFPTVNRADLRYLASVAPRYTSSIDAALALVERKLPGYRWSVGATGIRAGTHPDGKPAYVDGFRAGLTKASPLRPLPIAAHARTAPLALLLCLLRALSQQGGSP